MKNVDPSQLKPHPQNVLIYGWSDITSLANLIQKSQWISPLVITPDFTIISGHRRCAAAILLKWDTVPVKIRSFESDIAELEALLLNNASREKSTLDKVREGLAWETVEKGLAKKRQIDLAGSRPSEEKNLVQNFALGRRGKTRDLIAHRVGLGSGYNYSKASKVVSLIDELDASGLIELAQALGKVLNEQSVDAAYKLLKKPSNIREQILAAIARGDASNTKEARSLVEKQRSNKMDDENSSSSPQWRSYWNCHHRGETVDNQHFYCYKKGALSFIDKSADERGAECCSWAQRLGEYQVRDYLSNAISFKVELPHDLKAIVSAAAAVEDMTVSTWVAHLICANLRLELNNLPKFP